MFKLEESNQYKCSIMWLSLEFAPAATDVIFEEGNNSVIPYTHTLTLTLIPNSNPNPNPNP